MRYLIGLDIGTSSVKGVLMAEDGTVQKTAHGAFSYRILDNQCIEIDADTFEEVCCRTIRALASAELEIAGICASSASGNLLLLDEQNNPATPIYNWQDSRVTNEADDILENISKDDLYQKIGWPYLPNSFPLAQLCYIKKHSPETLANCGKVCMSTEYLYYQLTGKWGISTSAGTPFYLIDQVSGSYIPELMDIFGISEEQLPPVMPCGSKMGEISAAASEKCGLAPGTPVILGSFDHPSAARGVGVFHEGEMLLSCGTSWVGFFPIDDRNKATSAKLLIDPFLQEQGGAWGAMVSVASLSERIKLYADRYISHSEDRFQTMSSLAAKSPLGANGLSICLLDDPDDDTVKNHPKEDIARAIMEGAVVLLKNKLAELHTVGIRPKSAVMVGGPSEDPLYREIIQQMCGITVDVLHGAHAGAVGAAMLAGIGAGIYKDEANTFAICNEKR